MLARSLHGLTVLSIAGNGRDMSFSADTGMAECLVVARSSGWTNGPMTQTVLYPLAEGRRVCPRKRTGQKAALLTAVRSDASKDGPYGATPLMDRGRVGGQMITAHRDRGGQSWGAVRLSDYSVAQTAYALSESRLWLPGYAVPVELKMALLAEVGKLGFVHRDITGPAPRGPFDKVPPSPTATYPALWNHDAKMRPAWSALPIHSYRSGKEWRKSRDCLGHCQQSTSEP